MVVNIDCLRLNHISLYDPTFLIEENSGFPKNFFRLFCLDLFKFPDDLRATTCID